MTIREGLSVRKYGQTWKWYGFYKKGTLRGHWESTKGNPVLIFPPFENLLWEIVIAPSQESYSFRGKNAKERAFCVAEVFTRQKRN